MQRMFGGVDLAHEAGQRFARADFDEVFIALRNEALDRTLPAHGRFGLERQKRRRVAARLRVCVGVKRDAGAANVSVAVYAAIPRAASSMKGEWNAPPTFSRTARPRAAATSASKAASCSGTPETTVWPGQL